MLLLLTINMAAVTSHAYQLYVYVLDTRGRENVWIRKEKDGD